MFKHLILTIFQWRFRVKILQELLVLDKALRHGVRNGDKPDSCHCEDCEAFQSRDQGRMFPELQMLQVCHQLYWEGRNIILENQLVAARDDSGVSHVAIDRVNLGCRAFP